MKEIMEHYGSSLLQLAGGLAVFFIWMKLCQDGGALRQICLQYLYTICG